MENTVCFCIRGRTLILDQVLVEYNGIPIFFICKDGSEYYVALCIDTNRFDYYVVKTPLTRLYAMLFGKISMRDIFTQSKSFWMIHSGEDIDSDIVEDKDFADINLEFLPDEGAVFEILDCAVELYADNIRKMVYSPDGFENTITNVFIEDFSLGAEDQIIEHFIGITCNVIKSLVSSKPSNNCSYYSDCLQFLSNSLSASAVTEKTVDNTYTSGIDNNDIAA
ncbi:MAG: hypothetical protein ACI4PO_00200 [Faecousia sp.]